MRSGAPLVVVLHGCTQDPLDAAVGTGMHRLADREGFVVAHTDPRGPDATPAMWRFFRRHHR